MPTNQEKARPNVIRESYQLYRFAQAQVADMAKARLPQKYDLKDLYDLETASGKKIDVKACKIKIENGTRRMARFSINKDKDGRLLKDRIDFLVCLAYDEKINLVAVLCIPSADLPEWDTTIGFSLSPSRISRTNRWYKYITTLEELKNKLK